MIHMLTALLRPFSARPRSRPRISKAEIERALADSDAEDREIAAKEAAQADLASDLAYAKERGLFRLPYGQCPR